MTQLQTPRLQLVSATAEMIRSEMYHHVHLSQLLNCDIPRDWPPESIRDVIHLFAEDLEQRSSDDPWRAYYWISFVEEGSTRLLIGSGGFKGLPNEHGEVEIGYGVLPAFQNKGYATEAVGALTAYALAQTEITFVVAEAEPTNSSSVRVLQKNGFEVCSPANEPGHIRLKRQKRISKY